MTNELQITHLRWDAYTGEKSHIPYIVVNCTFKVTPDTYTENLAKSQSEEYQKVRALDDPKRYEDWLHKDQNWLKPYDGSSWVWMQKDADWTYLSKFNTYWFRQWIADCGPTRTILRELEYYQKTGKTEWVYRSTSESIMLKHLTTLGTYWD
jgi:hypothetical protein